MMETNISTKTLVTRKQITIKSNTVTGFSDEVDFTGLKLIDYKKVRVSNILPRNILLRISFSILRTFFKENSMVYEWTRSWNCKWIVIIKNSSFGPFLKRSEAIAFEKDLLRGTLL